MAEVGWAMEIGSEGALPCALPVGVTRRERRVVAVGSGVVDEDVDAAEGGGNVVPQPLDFAGVGQIGGKEGMAVAGEGRERGLGDGLISRKCTAMRQPRAASFSAMARPMPREAPVTRGGNGAADSRPHVGGRCCDREAGKLHELARP
jgi:hypothetical protein